MSCFETFTEAFRKLRSKLLQVESEEKIRVVRERLLIKQKQEEEKQQVREVKEAREMKPVISDSHMLVEPPCLPQHELRVPVHVLPLSVPSTEQVAAESSTPARPTRQRAKSAIETTPMKMETPRPTPTSPLPKETPRTPRTPKTPTVPRGTLKETLQESPKEKSALTVKLGGKPVTLKAQPKPKQATTPSSPVPTKRPR